MTRTNLLASLLAVLMLALPVASRAAEAEPVAPPTPAPEPAAAPVPAPAPAPVAQPEPAAPVAEPAAPAAQPEPAAPAAQPEPAAAPPPAEEAKTALELKMPTLMVGARIGVTTPQAFNKLETNFLAELEAAYQLPVLDQRLGVFLDFGYTQPTGKRTVEDPRLPGGSVTYDLLVRDFGFTLGLHFWQPISEVFLIYGGVGGKLYLTQTVINADSAGQAYGENNEQTTRGGFMLRLGAGYKLGPGSIVFEAHLEWVGITHLMTGGERDGESANTANLAFQLGYQVFVF